MTTSSIGQQYVEHRALLDKVVLAGGLDRQSLLDRLNRAIRYARTASPFYRALAAWHPIARVGELEGLPFTTKEDLQDAYPFGFLSVEPASLVRYAESTGTAGRRCAGFVTRQDWLINNLYVARAWASLLGPGDTLIVAVPYELTYVGADIDRVAELLQVGVVSVGVNNSMCPWTRVIELMRSHCVTALFCAPTRAIRLAQLARAAGLDPRRDLQVRKIICVGEPSSDSKREYIASAWQAEVYNHYGMTETMAVAVPCARRRLHLCEERLHAEVIDPETGAASAPGTPGELVITTLASEAMTLLRYRTGDLVRLESSECPCGNPQRVLTQFGRVADTFKTPSGTAYFHELDEILLAEPTIQPYYSVVKQDRQLTVSVAMPAAARALGGGATEGLLADLRQRLRARFGIAIQLCLEDEDAWLRRIDSSSKPGSALAQPVASLPVTKQTLDYPHFSGGGK